MIAKSLAIAFLSTVLVLGSQAELIEIYNSSSFSEADDGEESEITIVGPTVKPGQLDASFDESALQGFGVDDNGGISIVGPVHSGHLGPSIGELNQAQVSEDKVTEDPWQAYFNPNNQNVLGQSFPGVQTTAAPITTIIDEFVTPSITSEFTTQKPATTTKKHHRVLGGAISQGLGNIFNWNKHTTQEPQTDDKNKGHGILGGLKNVMANNKEVMNKAVESAKEAGQKFAQANKDFIEAGLKIKGSIITGLLRPSRPKNNA